MATFLFDKIIFGPVSSRRLGLSLGINLLPTTHKICSFDCLYCECGFNKKEGSSHLPTVNDVAENLSNRLQSMDIKPDVITFAGNGEPTLHPNFAQIIDVTIDLRNKFAPQSKIAVLSNATQLHRPDICSALKKIDQNILKIDAGDINTIRLLNRPQTNYSLDKVVQQITQFSQNLIIQTMFVNWNNHTNADDKSVSNWIKIIKKINPPKLMIYTIARDTPTENMQKIPLNRLNEIANLARNFVNSVEVSA